MFSLANKSNDDPTYVPLVFSLIKEHRNDEAKLHLQKYPGDIYLKGWMDDTPLHVAATSNNTEMAEYLINNGADVNTKRTGTYTTPLCWAASAQIALLLLEKGATMNDLELLYATKTDKTDVVNVLLTWGAAIDSLNPQYLECKSIACIKIYQSHHVSISGSDALGNNLLHKIAWLDLPNVLDYALKSGVPWSQNSQYETPYHTAKAGHSLLTVTFLETHYPSFFFNPIEPVQLSHALPYEQVWFMQQGFNDKESYIALTKNKLIRYHAIGDKLHVENAIRFNYPPVRNFTYDQNGHIILPTGDARLLIIDEVSFKLLQIKTLNHHSALDQITFLPKKKIFIGSGNNWKITVMSEYLTEIYITDTESGTILPQINAHENLFSFLSYDQNSFYELYHLTDHLSIKHIHTFFKDWNIPSTGFAFYGNTFAVSYHSTIEYYTYEQDILTMCWEMDITEYIVKQRDTSLIFIKSNLLAVGNGNHLLFIDIQKGIIVDQQALNITGHIIHVISDAVNNKLLITTSDEIVLHSLYTSIND